MEDFDQKPYPKGFAIALTIINAIIFLPISALMAFYILAASAIGSAIGGVAGGGPSFIVVIPALIIIFAPILTIICIFASIVLLNAGKPQRAERFCITPFFYTLGGGLIVFIFISANR